MKTRSVLVTGGAGFIGSHLVNALTKKRFHVRVVDNLSSGKLENLENLQGNLDFELIQGDLKIPSLAMACVDDIDLVIHLAANPDIRLGSSEPSVQFNENLLVTFNLLEAMRISEKVKSIVFASTSTIYGEAKVLPTPESYGPLFPISTYAASKLGCESLISSYCHSFDMSGVLLRFANIVGSRANHGVVVDFIEKLKRNPHELEILGDGTQSKSYLHVKDLVEAFFAVEKTVENAGKVEAYNVGSLDQVGVTHIAEIVCEEMGIRRPRFVFNECLKDGRGWRGDVRTMQLCVSKLMSLGWKPSLNSEESIRLSCRELLEGARSSVV